MNYEEEQKLNEEEQKLLEASQRGLERSAIDVQVADVLQIGLHADGAHHKQWALWRIGEILRLSYFFEDVEDRGMKPEEGNDGRNA